MVIFSFVPCIFSQLDSFLEFCIVDTYGILVGTLGFGCPERAQAKVKSLSCVRLFAAPWTVACQAPLSVGFSRQGSWSALLFPSPGDLPNPGIEIRSPALWADALPSELPGTQRREPSIEPKAPPAGWAPRPLCCPRCVSVWRCGRGWLGSEPWKAQSQ